MQGNKNFSTPYATACANGKLDVIRYLTEKRRCDPVHNNDRGLCAIDVATVTGNVDVLKYFVEKRGCDLRSNKDLLIFVVRSGNLETINYISSIVSSSSHALTTEGEQLGELCKVISIKNEQYLYNMLMT